MKHYFFIRNYCSILWESVTRLKDEAAFAAAARADHLKSAKFGCESLNLSPDWFTCIR